MARLANTLMLLGFLFGTQLEATTLLPCGKAFYDPAKYNCYDGNFLCPIINNQATVRCGSDCYLPSLYSCSNGKLGPAATSNIYTLVASAPGMDFDQQPIQASGRNFYLFGRTDSYCPNTVSRCPPGNITAFAGSSLDVEVPGGQNTYVAPYGYIGFTDPRQPGVFPSGSTFGGFDLKGGEAAAFAGYPLFACPVALSPPTPFYQVVANVTGTPPSCKKLVLLAEDYKGGYAAYMYI